MALNFVIPTSICLEFSILIWQVLLHIYMQSSAAKEIWYNPFFRTANEIFFGILLFMYIASFYWAFYFWSERQHISKHARNFRVLEGFLLSIGAIVSAMNCICILFTIKNNNNGDQFDGRMIAGGIVFVLFTSMDAYLYYMTPNYYETTPNSVLVIPVPGKTTDKIVLDGFGDFPRNKPFQPDILEIKKY